MYFQKLPKNPWYTIYTIFRCFLSPPPAKFLFFTLAMKVEKIASIAYRIDYQWQIAYQIAYFSKKSRTKTENRVPKTLKSDKNL